MASIVYSVLPAAHTVYFEVALRVERNLGVAVSSLMNGLSLAKKGPLSKLQCKKSLPVSVLLVPALSSVPRNIAHGSSS